MGATKVLKLNYHPESVAAVTIGRSTLSLSAGNKSGITITESGSSKSQPSSKFMVASASINKCGFYEDTPFPLLFRCQQYHHKFSVYLLVCRTFSQ